MSRQRRRAGRDVAAIEHGFLAREIEESAYVAQREIEDGRRTIVGVNAFREESDGEARPPISSIDPSGEREQVERLAAFRARRQADGVEKRLGSLRDMPAILDAVTGDATLGEVVTALKSVYGEHRPGG